MKNGLARAVFAGFLISTAIPADADANLGAYLAARQAAMEADYQAAARYYTEALVADPTNPQLLENAANSFTGLGQFDRAAPIADQMVALEIRTQLASIIRFTSAASNDNWDRVFSDLESGLMVSPLVDGLIQGWAAMGEGDVDRAIENFDAAIEIPQTRNYSIYHKALALASAGDFEGADALLASPKDGRAFSSRSAIAHAQVLSQLSRNSDALEMLQAVFGQTRNSTVLDLRTRLTNGETVPFTMVRDAKAGIGEVFLMVADLLRDETADGYILTYTRAAEYLDSTNTEATLASARLLEQMDRYELASETYSKIGADNPAYVGAELGRIDVLRRADRLDAAAEVADALARSHPDRPSVHAKLGDVRRELKDYEDAVAAYSNALAKFDDEDSARWVVYYTRAIAYHAIDQWPEAEADFRSALELNPEQPQVLNYLGYSLVERGEKLDEALEMIDTAVAARPDSGAIVDSLGWVLFQLGRYEDSVVYMERAASLEAVDPIINDHLGDVYWAVGRQIEAVFQWNRALSFDPDEDLANRIRDKLELGLDAVLEAEGAAPLQVALEP